MRFTSPELRSETRLVPTVPSGSTIVAARLAKLEAEVVAGTRDARSLVAFPVELVKRATVTFPEEAFGPPRPW